MSDNKITGNAGFARGFGREGYVRAAIYCRLSKDDDDRDGDSVSIQNQRALLEHYCKSTEQIYPQHSVKPCRSKDAEPFEYPED
jgi:hypothetical protein